MTAQHINELIWLSLVLYLPAWIFAGLVTDKNGNMLNFMKPVLGFWTVWILVVLFWQSHF